MTHPQKKERTNPVVGPSRSLTVWKCLDCGWRMAEKPSDGLCKNCISLEVLVEAEYLPRSLHDAEVGRLRKERDDAKEYVLRVERQRNALLDAVARLQQVESEDEKIEAERDLLALADLPNPDAVEGNE